jgi:predicted metal-dependent peptidase
MAKKNKSQNKPDPAVENFQQGCEIVNNHPIFHDLNRNTRKEKVDSSRLGKGLAAVDNNGVIIYNHKLRAEPKEWARAIAHCLLHLAMGHISEMPKRENQVYWNAACDVAVERFLNDVRIAGVNNHLPTEIGSGDENKLYEFLLANGMKSSFTGHGTAGLNLPDMIFAAEAKYSQWNKPPEWQRLFAVGLRNAVASAVSIAAGRDEHTDSASTAVLRAKEWFISSYPLLGALAASFKVIENPEVCQRMDIRVAAVSSYLREIYINPGAALSDMELRFVMAHEILHAALRHDARVEWRDAYLWNVACDFVINMWLVEMGVGERPSEVLYDEQFKGMSAEDVYDRIVGDMRLYRKLATLRGVGMGDILGEPGSREFGADTDLDAFYRRAISQGLEYHQEQGRGYLPAGLIEEIRVLAHPPIPWDVELARWFDDFFEPLEKLRTYARVSRRQSATPDIPRPNRVVNQQALDKRTFGVVLDTSGSMERSLLAVALGAIASYSISRDVPGVRVVFCDADAYDQGYMKPEDIAGTVKVKGRGGTVLQPGIEILHRAEDFPKEAPILIITDGECEDRLVLYNREHAFLLPWGNRLPFVAKGKIFRVKE